MSVVVVCDSCGAGSAHLGEAFMWRILGGGQVQDGDWNHLCPDCNRKEVSL